MGNQESVPSNPNVTVKKKKLIKKNQLITNQLVKII